MTPLDLDRNQLEQLDKETLISIILMLQQQVRELQQIVADSPAGGSARPFPSPLTAPFPRGCEAANPFNEVTNPFNPVQKSVDSPFRKSVDSVSPHPSPSVSSRLMSGT